METRWITACAAAQHVGVPQLMPQTGGTTRRATLVSGLAGETLRVVLGEKYSAVPASYSRVVVETSGLQSEVTFAGVPAVTVGPGEIMCSDTVPLPVAAGGAVTLWLYGEKETSASVCMLGQAHSAPGDYCGQNFEAEPFSLAMPNGMQAAEELTGVIGLQVSVQADAQAAAIVAFGDSITKMDFWVSPLRASIQRETTNCALLNCGIGGNRLLLDTNIPLAPGMQIFGVAGLKRMEWDVFGHPGVKVMLLALGINDISQPGANEMNPPLEEICSLEALIDGYKAVIAQAHSRGIRVVGCTITPFGGYASYNEKTEVLRVAANDWILNSGAFDATVDFAAAICDPARPSHLLEAYDSGDHLHPGPEGGATMAAAVDVQALLSLVL